jgi:hypothetical protein
MTQTNRDAVFGRGREVGDTKSYYSWMFNEGVCCRAAFLRFFVDI